MCDLEKVKKLTLSYSKISNEGFSDLKEAAKLKQLKALGLLNTRITDVGLNELTKLQQLGFVNLRSTKVTMGGVDKLKKALPEYRILSNPKK